MKTGILGGTFNPIHLAHLSIAEEVRTTCALDRVLFIPAATPPHKQVAEETPFTQRLTMVEEAIAGHPGFYSSSLEAERPGKSFSVETLEILRREHPDDTFYFIIGLDSYRDISSWKDFRRLFELAHIVVTTRPGVVVRNPLDVLPVAAHSDFCYDDQSRKMLHKSGNYVIFLEETCLDISSTEIRRKIASGESIRELVPESVASYIDTHGLYRNV